MTRPAAASLSEDQAARQQVNKIGDVGDREEDENRKIERERLELAVRTGQLDIVERMMRISKSELGTASLALMHFAGLFENEADAVKFLADALKNAKNESEATDPYQTR